MTDQVTSHVWGTPESGPGMPQADGPGRGGPRHPRGSGSESRPLPALGVGHTQSYLVAGCWDSVTFRYGHWTACSKTSWRVAVGAVLPTFAR